MNWWVPVESAAHDQHKKETNKENQSAGSVHRDAKTVYDDKYVNSWLQTNYSKSQNSATDIFNSFDDVDLF